MFPIKEEVCQVYNASMTVPPFHLECLEFEKIADADSSYSNYHIGTNDTGTGSDSLPGIERPLDALVDQKTHITFVYFLVFYMIAVLFYFPHLKIFRFEPRKVPGSWTLVLHFLLAPIALLLPPIFGEFSKALFAFTGDIAPVVRWVIGIQVLTSFIMTCMAIVINVPSTCKAKIEGKAHPTALLLPVLSQAAIFCSNLFYWAVFEMAISTPASTSARYIFSVTIGGLSYSSLAVHVFADLIPCYFLRHCRACSTATDVCPHIKHNMHTHTHTHTHT